MAAAKGGQFAQKPSSEFPRCGRQPAALVISEPQTSITELFAKDTVLLPQVFDHVHLALIHPSGNRDQQKPEEDQGLSPCIGLIIYL